MTPPATRDASGSTGRRRGWVVGVAIMLLLPLALGLLLGWFDLNAPVNESLNPVGDEAHNLLSGFPDRTLIVEIDYQSSAGPPPAASVNVLEQRINQTCAKSSVGIEEYPFSSNTTNFHESDLLGLETSVRHSWPSWGTMVLGYLYLNGRDADNADVLGLAYRGASIAVFGGTIAATAPFGSATAVTTTVMVHEFGHELGLVGIVGAAPNEDPNHPYHSSDPNDVMYWAVDSTALFGGLLGAGGPPNTFDAADLGDLSTVRSTPVLLELVPWIVLAASLVGATSLIVLRVRRRTLRRPSQPAPTPTPRDPETEL